MRHIIVVAVLAIIASACAPVTETTLRQSEDKQRSFNIDQRYQTVFQTILDKSRACFLEIPGPSQFTVVGNRVNRDKVAEVVVAEVFGPKSREVLMLIDVIYLNDQETQVRSYHSSRRADLYVANIRAWLDKENSSCKAEEA